MIEFNENMVPGYVIHHISDCDGMPIITGSHRAYASLWFGDLKPQLILSSEETMKKAVRALIPKFREPVMYGVNFGFRFNGAIWSYPEPSTINIGEWVVMLNHDMKEEPRFNGAYRYE